MLIERDLLQKILPWLFENKVLIIKGARQTGKTTLLQIVKDVLLLKHNIPKSRIFYFSIDKELGNPIFIDVHRFIRYMEILQMSHSSPLFVFLDEFQYIKNAGLFLKISHDYFQDKIHFIVTGSSSLEISKNSEFLTGRKIEFTLKQFSFLEFLKADKETKILTTETIDFEDLYFIYGPQLKEKLYQYISFGGFPEVVLQQDVEKKKLILKEILTTYIQKDISAFFRIHKLDKFNILTRILTLNIGQLINKYELSNTIGINLETLEHYFSILQGTYVFTFLSPFFSNKRKETIKMKKVYVEDSGYYWYFNNYNFVLQYDFLIGSIVENFVFNELSRIFLGDVFFYRTVSKSEIDFVAQIDNNLLPIEVKFRNKVIKRPETIKKFTVKYPSAKKSIIVTKEDFKKTDDTYFIPVFLFPFFIQSIEKYM